MPTARCASCFAGFAGLMGWAGVRLALAGGGGGGSVVAVGGGGVLRVGPAVAGGSAYVPAGLPGS